MVEEQNYIQPQDESYEEIDIMELFRKLFKEWKSIVKWGCIGVVLGLIFALSAVKSYTVTTKMAPEIASKSSGSSLSSLASLAGVNLGNMSTTDAVYPDLYPEIVGSTPFKVDLFSVPVEVRTKEGPVKTDLYDYVLNYTKDTWYCKVMEAPVKALGWVMSLSHEKTGKIEGHAEADPYNLTKEQREVLKFLNENISLSVDKKTGIITTSVSMQDPKVAAALATEVMDRLQEYVSEYRTEKARHDLAYYEQLRDEAQTDYYAAQQKYARYVDANQGVVLQRVMIEQQRLQNESELKYQLYNQTEQQVQLAKAKVQQETPVCVVLQPSSVPMQGTPSRAKILVVWVFLAVVIDILWILWGKDLFNKLKSPENEEEAVAGR